MNIVLMAEDFMQSEEFRKIAEALRTNGHTVQEFLAYGKTPEFSRDQIESDVPRSDFVLLAVSNSFRETLQAANAAMESGIPFGIYAGSQPGCYLGKNLEPLRESARIVFVFNNEEVPPAEERFPNAKVVVSGSPNWEKFFFPETSQEEARAKLGVKEDERVILVPGDKDLALNILLFGLVIEALGELNIEGKFRVVIGLHPGDPNPLSAYANLARFSDVPVTFVRRSNMEGVTENINFVVAPTSHVLHGADIVVTFVSTLGYEAACQRIPVICFFPRYGEIQLERDRGHSKWEQCENGTAVEVRGSNMDFLSERIRMLLLGSPKLKARQETVYPAPEKLGSSAQRIVDALEAFAGSR